MLKSGKICMSVQDLPSFLWDGELHPRDGHDNNNEFVGLLKSFPLLHVSPPLLIAPEVY